ncbi:hypothetical protein HMPREF1556_01673, partial [Porphyromonas sp. oral taxon 278 str. W7784]
MSEVAGKARDALGSAKADALPSPRRVAKYQARRREGDDRGIFLEGKPISWVDYPRGGAGRHQRQSL